MRKWKSMWPELCSNFSNTHSAIRHRTGLFIPIFHILCFWEMSQGLKSKWPPLQRRARAVDKISRLVSGTEIGGQLPHYCQLQCSSNKKKQHKIKGSGGGGMMVENESHESAFCWSLAQQSAVKTSPSSVKLWEIKLQVLWFHQNLSAISDPLNVSVCVRTY